MSTVAGEVWLRGSFLILALSFTLSSAPIEAGPNAVVFILTDDQGHCPLNANGRDDCQSLGTPNLD
jgi:hypothetical protein